jgi:hypothetical protein
MLESSRACCGEHPFLTGDHQLLTANGRRAEICYVMHRGDPAGGVLLHIKTFYPEDAYRLPTGGIHVGEAVLADAATRDLRGDRADCWRGGRRGVRRAAGWACLTYDLQHRTLGAALFATYSLSDADARRRTAHAARPGRINRWLAVASGV